MSAIYTLYVILPKFSKRGWIVKSVHQFLLKHQADWNNDCYLYAAESSEIDLDPLQMPDADGAVTAMIQDINLGSMDYCLLDHLINVAYKFSGPATVQAVKISIPDSRFEGSNRSFYQTLTKQLHKFLSAKRTILGWDLERQGFDWQIEVKQVRRNMFLGKYDIDLHA